LLRDLAQIDSKGTLQNVQHNITYQGFGADGGGHSSGILILLDKFTATHRRLAESASHQAGFAMSRPSLGRKSVKSMIRKSLFGAFLFVLQATFMTKAIAMIEGADDRSEVSTSAFAQHIAHSVAVMASPVFFTVDESQTTHLNFPNISTTSSHNLCPEQKFGNQPSATVSCTGFLVAPDLLVTAGHCMVNTGEVKHVVNPQCQQFDWFFGFQYGENGTIQSDIPPDRHYKCKEVIYAIQDTHWDSQTNTSLFHEDFALIRLDRPVTGRAPLPLTTSQIKVGDQITMVSHPLGLPAKFTNNATVTFNDAQEYFRSDLDAVMGDSGAPVLNVAGQVDGLLVRRFPSADLLDDPHGRECSIYAHCDGASCNDPKYPRGAHITRLDRLRPIIVEALHSPRP
jgi:V8-like Glu-specific endopeptidase